MLLCNVQAWSNAMPIAELYKEFADRWGSDDFHQYCQCLEQQADAALQHASKVQSAHYCCTAESYVRHVHATEPARFSSCDATDVHS